MNPSEKWRLVADFENLYPTDSRRCVPARRGVMKNRISFAHIVNLKALLLLVVVALPSISAGQGSYTGRTRAIDDANSRAEQEAERMVSLSAEKIIPLLQQEPGLLLQVKKMLVRKAYGQGCLLDPQDLNNEALFVLIGRDENIRVLVTREIEDREYVRVKPTRRELEREQQRKALQGLNANKAQEEADLKGKSQEDAYWSRHNRDSQNPASPPPSVAPPRQPGPQIRYDHRRQSHLAQAQP